MNSFRIPRKTLFSPGKTKRMISPRGKLLLGLLPAMLVLSLLSSASLPLPLSSPALAAPAESPSLATSADLLVFTPYTIHQPKWFHWMSSRSLSMDSTGNPHIAYGGDHLYYASYSGGAWQVETVDSAFGVGKYAALVLDSSNRPHISYYDAINGALKYATHDGSAWQITTIEQSTIPISLIAPDAQTLEIDPELAPRALDPREWGETFLNLPPELLGEADPYDEFQAPAVNLDAELALPAATESLAEGQTSLDPASAMSIASVDGRGVGLYTSIDLDPFNKPAISYYDANNGDLKYARWTGSAWDVSIVDSSGDVGRYTSLAIDSSGYAQISYYDATLGDLKHARWDGIKWVLRKVDGTGGDVGQYSSIALDTSKNAHISYYDFSLGDLKYARWNGSTWNIRGVDSAGDVGMYSSIVLTKNNIPYISYYDQTNTRLKFAYLEGGVFKHNVVAILVGRYTSIALVNDSPRISFYNAGLGELRYATPTSTGWQVSPAIDRAADVGSYVSMQLDPAQRPHISYYDDLLDDLWYAKWNGSAWENWKIDTAGAVGRYTSLAVNSAGDPRISYYDDSNSRLKYASYNGGIWSFQTVAGGEFGIQSSLALDNAGNPRIAFYDSKNGDLKVAVWAPASLTWVIRLVDSDQDVGRWPSLKIDASNQMHISYYHATQQGLKYARLNADGSVIQAREFLTGMRGIGNFSSLALDSAGNPHIAYFNDNSDDLWYIRFQGVWQAPQLIDSLGVIGWNPSLALDSSGTPHVSYYDYTQRHLRHAYRTSNGWKMSIVDNRGEVGEYSAIAVLDDATPVISYYDRTNGDLKFAISRFVEAQVVFLPVVRR